MHNQRLIQAAFEHQGPGAGVCWLPPYHDMGLIGGLLQTVFHGASCVLLSPLAFLRRPACWLEAITRYRADTSGGPNFAYDYCVDRIPAEERNQFDLSRWSVAAVGAEPIRARTLDRFAAAFAPAGFRREAFYPCYGLAEATLLVTGGPKSRPPVVRSFDTAALAEGQARPVAQGPDARPVVGCGRPWLDTEVCIVNPESARACPDGTVGEVWVAGAAVAQGYWGRLEETEATFHAHRSDSGTGPYLRTGDLGFLEAGELFITGRIKDLIVIRGRNHDPADIEMTAQAAHPALRPGCGAAFEVDRDGSTALVLVHEVDRRARGLDVARLVGDIRQAIAERHELQASDVLLLEPGSIPKTSSGKVQRHLCREGYERGTLRLLRGGAG